MIFRSTTIPEFWRHYDALPKEVQSRADKQFSLFIEDPLHPSLYLKPVGEFWAVRVTGAYRALSVRNGNTFVWFWIGTHDETNSQRLRLVPYAHVVQDADLRTRPQS